MECLIQYWSYWEERKRRERENKNAVLLQVMKRIEIEMKKANEQGKAIRGIKLYVMKEFNIPWLNCNILDYYLMKADK